MSLPDVLAGGWNPVPGSGSWSSAAGGAPSLSDLSWPPSQNPADLITYLVRWLNAPPVAPPRPSGDTLASIFNPLLSSGGVAGAIAPGLSQAGYLAGRWNPAFLSGVPSSGPSNAPSLSDPPWRPSLSAMDFSTSPPLCRAPRRRRRPTTLPVNRYRTCAIRPPMAVFRLRPRPVGRWRHIRAPAGSRRQAEAVWHPSQGSHRLRGFRRCRIRYDRTTLRELTINSLSPHRCPPAGCLRDWVEFRLTIGPARRISGKAYGLNDWVPDPALAGSSPPIVLAQAGPHDEPGEPEEDPYEKLKEPEGGLGDWPRTIDGIPIPQQGDPGLMWRSLPFPSGGAPPGPVRPTAGPMPSGAVTALDPRLWPPVRLPVPQRWWSRRWRRCGP